MLDSAWCLVIAQIQFSLIKKMIGHLEQLLTPPTSDTISFLPKLPAPKSGRHMCITPYMGFYPAPPCQSTSKTLPTP